MTNVTKELADRLIREHSLSLDEYETLLTDRDAETAEYAGVPIVNYGIAIAHMNGILRRSLSVFGEKFL